MTWSLSLLETVIHYNLRAEIQVYPLRVFIFRTLAYHYTPTVQQTTGSRHLRNRHLLF